MKKILFAAVALVAMASCATDEVVSRPDNKLAIEFDNAFVENSTRAADITASNLANFGVYGSVINSQDQQGMIFANKEVAIDSNGKYTYQDPQYWIEGASYDFLAFAPFADAKWAYTPAVTTAAENGTISFNNEAAEANQDFLYAYTAKETGSITSAPAPVAFTFNHMLSRVKFTITNGFTAGSNIKLDITNLTITNAHSNGTLAIKEGVPQTWAVGTDIFARNFGSTTQLADNNTSWTTEHFYLIPANAEYTVTFDVTLHQAGVPVDTYTRTATVDLNLQMGKSYNVKATLNSSNTAEDGTEIYPIEFTVASVEDWVEAGDVNATVSTPVSTAAELEEAIANGEPVALAADITLPTEGLTVNTNANIDLNGYTLTVLESNFVNNANLIISNGTISGSDTQLGRRAIVNKGNLTMNNVTVAQVYADGGSAINNDGATAVAVLNNVTVNAQNMAVSNKNGATMTINGGNFVGNGTGGSYAIVNQLDSTMTINGGTFEGGHGVVSSTEGSVTTLNGGTYHCTCTYTGNSDWTLWTGGPNAETYGYILYDEDKCTFSTDRTDGKIYVESCEDYITEF